ncbi:UNVERIFIED_CONTAM: hypothetical protein PYX00_004968 [Menopon gallinae]|uniref:PSI domain-containing protein n=1 Tax=Menopon gallinae TaxID=328185 RepID=A0AAW2I7B2_9NEOP
MACRSFYFNVFYILFIFHSILAERISESDEHFISYFDGVPDSSTYHFVTLTRTVRQTPLEKKNEAPVADKGKTTKKPTAMEVKSTTTAADSEQKSKTTVNKKDSLSAKIVPSTPPSDVQNPVHHEEHEHEAALETGHAIETFVNTTNESPSASVSPKNTTEPPLTNITVPDDTEDSKLLDVDWNDGDLNQTLKDHNITVQKEDHHLYYNSSITSDSETFHHYWVELDKLKDVKDVLSKSFRKATPVKLSFDFPFYGHLVRKIIIATGGFLYTGDYVHSWLSVTQYIAPLMAHFDTGHLNSSSIKYVDNGTSFTVQWENVVLQDKPDEGNFTFQCTLFKNGDIVFVYKYIPNSIDKLISAHHSVKVGVSDAYVIDRTIFFVRRKTIYEYHRVNIEREQIRNQTVILLNALDTCLDKKDCHSCVTEIPNFECNWCMNRCSNGMDRYRQDWLAKGCKSKKRKTAQECLAEEVNEYGPRIPLNKMNMGIAGIMGILFVICLALGIGVWLFYAYRNPHTPAGQFLIRYRPSQWSWNRREARYTAATIHM